MNSVLTKNGNCMNTMEESTKPASIDNLSRGLTILRVKTFIYTAINHNIWQKYPLTTTTLQMDMNTDTEP